jgi:hypothetical protein
MPLLLYPSGEIAPGTHWIGGWVSQSQAGQHGEMKILASTGTWNSNPLVVLPIAIHYPGHSSIYIVCTFIKYTKVNF